MQELALSDRAAHLDVVLGVEPLARASAGSTVAASSNGQGVPPGKRLDSSPAGLAGVLQSRHRKDAGPISQLRQLQSCRWRKRICKIRLIALEKTLHSSMQAMVK